MHPHTFSSFASDAETKYIAAAHFHTNRDIIQP
jgi:hypothetical protein